MIRLITALTTTTTTTNSNMNFRMIPLTITHLNPICLGKQT